ncbi:OmpA family protein [Chitinophaga sp.]|uniref:OmpA family protein n=1 Tax=Chitinophaga sp. TaxID=1869181 RepID=UPI00261D679F|nr:OmpA family protein [uncultured Chitinophaga sp.]
MAFDLIETLKQLFNNEFAGKAAAQLGESESGIQKALGGIIPTVLTGLLAKAGSGDSGSLMNLLHQASGTDISQLANTGAGIPTGLLAKGSEFLQSLFGGRSNEIAGAVANYAGIRPQSADTLLQTAAPAALGIVGKHADTAGLGTTGVLELLTSQKDKILASVPSGLGLAGILGLGSLSDIGARLSSFTGAFKGAAHTPAHTVHETTASGGNQWVTWLVIAIAAILLLWWLLRGCGAQETMTVVESDSVTAIEDTHAAAPAPPITRESIKVTLPDGKVLDAYKGGIEDRLVQFLQDPDAAAGKDVWFDFDNLNFHTGSAEITPESQVQINNLAAILNAFPKAKIKIGGYTDATGDAKKNQQLSQERATAVASALSAANVKPVQLLGAEGYGSQFAKAAADAPDEERKLDRRISVSVREK